jgi:hypothetical protein
VELIKMITNVEYIELIKMITNVKQIELIKIITNMKYDTISVSYESAAPFSGRREEGSGRFLQYTGRS